MTICQGIQVQLISSGSGHIQLPARRPPHGNAGMKQSSPLNVYPTTIDRGKEAITMDELKRIHLHLRHCSEFALRNLLQDAHKTVSESMIADLFRRCACSENVYRIAPPKISSWISKFNGEIVGIDIVFPFSGMRPVVSAKRTTALMIV